LRYFADVLTSDEGKKPVGPDIIENYRDFEPPSQVRKLVEELLESVPGNYLKGLKTIVLCNRAALTRDQRRQKVWGRGRKYRLAEARGAYYRATNSRPATVWLYVDNILKASPAWMLRIPIARYAEFGEVLFHEIGHHIHTVHVPIYDGKENVAEDWSRKLGQQFFRKHYWYLVPFKYPMLTVVKTTLRVITAIRRDRRRQKNLT
jgi:hypothetical protein